MADVLLHPRLAAAACIDPTLAYMIKRGGPLTRERWFDINYLDGPPKPWTAEHELAVPEFWQDPERRGGSRGIDLTAPWLNATGLVVLGMLGVVVALADERSGLDGPERVCSGRDLSGDRRSNRGDQAA